MLKVKMKKELGNRRSLWARNLDPAKVKRVYTCSRKIRVRSSWPSYSVRITVEERESSEP